MYLWLQDVLCDQGSVGEDGILLLNVHVVEAGCDAVHGVEIF